MYDICSFTLTLISLQHFVDVLGRLLQREHSLCILKLTEYCRELANPYASLIVLIIVDFEKGPCTRWKYSNCKNKIKTNDAMLTYSANKVSFKIFCWGLYGRRTSTNRLEFFPAIWATSIAPAVDLVCESITKKRTRAFSFARCSSSSRSGVHSETCCKINQLKCHKRILRNIDRTTILTGL